MGFHVRDRQSQAGALEQGAAVPHLDHGRDAGRGTPANLRVCRKKSLAQFRQAVAAEAGDHQQAIGLEL